MRFQSASNRPQGGSEICAPANKLDVRPKALDQYLAREATSGFECKTGKERAGYTRVRWCLATTVDGNAKTTQS